MKRLFFAVVFFKLIFNVFPQDFQIPKLDIKAYLNNIEIEGPVYKNTYSPPVQGINYLSSYVKLKNIFSLLNADIKINNNIIEINGDKTEKVIINYINQKNITINSSLQGGEIRKNLTSNSIIIINNEYYIQISMVRYLINGALQEDENSVTLYTNDYERQDIPLTLNDCYIELNKILDDQIKYDIKNSTIEGLVKYHMGLGMWIRNNWIRQTNKRITKLFLDNGVRNPDDMSQTIIIGYHYYLNGINKTIKEIYNE